MYGTTGATAVSRLGPLPLVIGVTGHRDLREEDREALEAQVRGVFAELRVRYRDTPAILLTPLAEGADRLAARVALECNARLIVPLPMPRALYEADFQTPASLAEFDAILQRAKGGSNSPWCLGTPRRKSAPTGSTAIGSTLT
jgi:hypothetical protein